jgi:hypothetical protein
VRYEQKMSIRGYKIGVLYASNGQYDESDMYNNSTYSRTLAHECARGSLVWINTGTGSPAFEEFLSLLGDKVVLKGWTRYRAGLNVHSTYIMPHDTPLATA